MTSLIAQTGPYGVLMGVLVLLNLGLVVWTLVHLRQAGAEGEIRLKNRINAILFWGGMGALVGILGQANGLYLALKAIARASQISTPVIMEGLAISFLTTIMGLVFLFLSAIAWFFLRGIHQRRVGPDPALL